MAAITYEGKVQESFTKLLDELLSEETDREIISKILEVVIDLSIKNERGENITSNLNGKVNDILDYIKNYQDED